MDDLDGVQQPQSRAVTVEDLRAVALLRREIRNTRVSRERLKPLLEHGNHLIALHHANRALANVTVARQSEDLRDKIAAKQNLVAKLSEDVGIAEREHQRLRELNESLLCVALDKELEKDRLSAMIHRLTVSETKVAEYTTQLALQTSEEVNKRKHFAKDTKCVISKIGGHHGEVMALEQQRLDLKLELGSLQKKLAILKESTSESTRSKIDEKGDWELRLHWNRPPGYLHQLKSCTNPACSKIRQQHREARARLKMIEDANGRNESHHERLQGSLWDGLHETVPVSYL